MTYPLPLCNSDSHFLLFLQNQDAGMLEIRIDHDDNNAKVRIVADKSNQQFETMTYPLILYNSDHSHFLHFPLHQDNRMLEMRIDQDNNDAKVSIAEYKSNPHLKQ